MKSQPMSQPVKRTVPDLQDVITYAVGTYDEFGRVLSKALNTPKLKMKKKR